MIIFGLTFVYCGNKLKSIVSFLLNYQSCIKFKHEQKNIKKMKFTFIMLGTLLFSAGLTAQTKLTPKNIDAVIKEMTNEEKANILVGYSFGK